MSSASGGTLPLYDSVNDATPVYFFTSPPRPFPRMYFDEIQLAHMLMHYPHQYTVAHTRADGHTSMGRWTLHLTPPPDPFTECNWQLGTELLTHARLCWEDWEPGGARMIWVLSEVSKEALWWKKRQLRLGVWPD